VKGGGDLVPPTQWFDASRRRDKAKSAMTPTDIEPQTVYTEAYRLIPKQSNPTGK
jgi:hypothetical protein